MAGGELVCLSGTDENLEKLFSQFLSTFKCKAFSPCYIRTSRNTIRQMRPGSYIIDLLPVRPSQITHLNGESGGSWKGIINWKSKLTNQHKQTWRRKNNWTDMTICKPGGGSGYCHDLRNVPAASLSWSVLCQVVRLSWQPSTPFSPCQSDLDIRVPPPQKPSPMSVWPRFKWGTLVPQSEADSSVQCPCIQPKPWPGYTDSSKLT